MAEIIGGLAFLGNYINNRKSKTQLDDDVAKLNVDKKIGRNIFDGRNVSRVDNEITKMAKKKYRDGKNTKKTGVVSKGYNSVESFDGSLNSDSVFTEDDDNNNNNNNNNNCDTCDRSIQSSNSIGNMSNFDPSYFLNKTDKMMDNRIHESKFTKKIRDNNNFLSQFEPMAFDNFGDPVSANAVGNVSGSFANVRRMENERDLALNGGYSNFGETNDMTYGVVDKEHFTHNNMQPNFKSKDANPYRTQHANEINQRKMELFTGVADRADYTKRSEHKPLFGPLTNVTNIYGTPVMAEYLKDRYMPSKEKRNELPFQPIKVTPGLNLGYNEQAKFGYHDPHRVLYRTTDEIRPANKPKITYGSVVIPGQKGSRGPVIGNIVKKRPMQFRENLKSDMVKTGGYIKAPKIVGEIKDAATQRGLLRRVQYGPANANHKKATPTELQGKIKDTTRQSFEQADPRNIHLVDGLMARPNHEPYVPKATQRCQETKYLGPLGTTEQGKVYTYDPVAYTPDQTMREIHGETDRTGNVTGNYKKHRAVDYNDVPDQTMRDVHNQYDRAGNFTGDYKKHQAVDYNDVPDQTMRDVHNQYDRAGNFTGDHKKNQMVDYNDVPDQTMRDVHNQYDRAGNFTGNYKKHRAVDYNDVPDQTMRDVHNQYDRAGNVTGNYKKHRAVDYNDVPSQTMRDVHNQYDRAGNVTGNYKKHQAVDYNDVPDQTMRDVHNQYDRAGNVTGNYKKHQAVDYNDVPDQTMRDVHNQYDRAGNVTGNHKKNQMVDYNDVPDQTMRDVHNQYDRAGNFTGNHKKNQMVDYNDVPDQTMRDVHNQYDRAGNVTGNHKKSQMVDYNDVPDQTMRDVHNQYDRAGNFTGSSRKNQMVDYNDVPNITQRNTYNYNDVGIASAPNKKNKYVDFNDVPNLTQRNTYNYNDVGIATAPNRKGKHVDFNDVPDLTQRNTYNYNDVGIASAPNKKNRYVDFNDVPDMTQRNTYNYNDVGAPEASVKKHVWTDYDDVPDVTMREITGATNRIQPAKGNSGNRDRSDAYASNVNTAREEISKGRAPTLINYNMGPTTAFTEYSFNTNRDNENTRQMAPGLLIQTTNKLKSKGTHTPLIKWYHNDGKDRELLEDTLDKNPYINNVVHKSRKIKY
jgi:hypothetical protein